MDKINKYEQNNHTGRRANGRARRTKRDLSRRSGRFARTVNPRAKTPALQLLTISNVPRHVLDAIDDLAARQDRSRSSFVRCALQRVIAGYRAEAA
jgi:Ribbon-helix-helix protein, copG family